MIDEKIKALTFDTGGTILDWHSGFYNALSETGKKYQIKKDWHAIANELRRRSLGKVLNQGEMEKPKYNFDDAHKLVLDELCKEYELDIFSEEERRFIAWVAPHNFKVWPDFPQVLTELKKKFICCSFTILSFRIIIDTARKNGLSWDSIFSCEAIRKYKILPEAYQTVTKWLQIEPNEICMVACHNFDLDAAKAVGFKTAFVKRPDEWGPAGPPDPEPNPDHDIIVDSFPELARSLSEYH